MPLDTPPPSTPPPASDASKWQVSETVAIAAASVLGYWFAYAYELGYCKRFAIPAEFISLELGSVFGAVGAVWLSCAVLALFAHHVAVQFGGRARPYAYRLRVLLLPAAMIVLGLLSLPAGAYVAWTGLALSFGLVAFNVLLPLWLYRRTPTLAAKLAAFDSTHSSGAPIRRALAGRPWLWLVAFPVAFGLLCYWVGWTEAGGRRWFLVPSSAPQSVVLRVYGDAAVCAKFDEEVQTVSPVFSVLKVGENPDLTLSLRPVGPLRVRFE